MNESEKRPGKFWRRLALIFWLALGPLWMALNFYPIRDSHSRLGLIIMPLMLLCGALILFWKRRVVRAIVGAIIVSGAAIFLLPGHEADAQIMRSRYVSALRSYTNVPYVWGGETHRGIDCSGLLRAAFIDANFQQGLHSANARHLRRAFEMWWHDSSALALRDEYRGWTKQLSTTPSLNEADYSRLQPGDIAVTTGGGHCMAYLGNKTWIEADPSALVGDKVIQVTVPAKNAWFSTPMVLLRWQQFADKP